MRISAEERFLRKVRKHAGGCWQWVGATSGRPHLRYGRFYYKGEPIPAHRASWMMFRGKIPGGMFVCHHCDNTRCVNPEHLWLGTCDDNLKDMARKGRACNQNKLKTICSKGHEYTADNTYYDKAGKRHCRECRKSAVVNLEHRKLYMRAYRARKSAAA